MRLAPYLAYPSRRLAAEAAAGGVLSRVGKRFLRKRIPPSLRELASAAQGALGSDPRVLLGDSGSSDEIAAEHARLRSELEARYSDATLPFPDSWAIETGTSFLLYALTRAVRPAAVLEMGVANGHSSFYILRALEANGRGTLHSFDLRPEAGDLLSERERAFWDFRLIDRRRTAESLVAHLRALPQADICFHDADHGYLAQYFEFGRLWGQLTDGGLLVADDVDASYALLDFCDEIGERPQILIDGRKAVAVVARPAHAVRPQTERSRSGAAPTLSAATRQTSR